MLLLLFVTQPTVRSLALNGSVWTAKALHEELSKYGAPISLRTVHRDLQELMGNSVVSSLTDVRNSSGNLLNPLVGPAVSRWLGSARKPFEILQLLTVDNAYVVVLVNAKKRLIWRASPKDDSSIREAIFDVITFHGKRMGLVPHGSIRSQLRTISLPDSVTDLSSLLPPEPFTPSSNARVPAAKPHSYLDDLEKESINIIREAVAVSRKPAMLFSMGKDSMAMLTLAGKAFSPGPLPFPLVIIDTRWKFQDMYRFREHLQADPQLSTIVYVNPEAIDRDVNPFSFGSATHTDITKTQALRKVLDEHQFDFVFGGARRDEEKSRAKERVFSVRNANHGWDPKNQRPELWNLYNTSLVSGQTMRVFPLSNWTELDIWRYLEREQVDLVPLYFSALRPFVIRNNALIMVDDERFPLDDGEEVFIDYIRFRTLGCYPLTGGVLSRATTIADIITELESSATSERSSRVIDFDQGASMEQKKKDGYF